MHNVLPAEPSFPLPVLTLKKRSTERLRSGHHWVFSNELSVVPTELPAGSFVEIQDSFKRSYGAALFNPHSLVAARLLKTTAEELTTRPFVELLYERVSSAYEFRKRIFPTETSYRLVFGESDRIPGVIVDLYTNRDKRPDRQGTYLSLQTLSAGMDARKAELVEALRRVLPDTQAIIEKNNSALRKLEGLELHEGILWSRSESATEAAHTLQITENDIRYELSLLKGQKTGYFLDQKLNRLRLQELARGLKVLDCFTNQGGFALNAAHGGAVHVLGLDSSPWAIERCRVNARLNSLESVAQFETMEVFEFLHNETMRMEMNSSDSNTMPSAMWDCIVLDPPAFTKSRKHIPVAQRGYAKINRMALKLLPSGGLLATGSCSHHIHEDMFLDIIREQAFLEGRSLRLVFRGVQSPCHPILLGMPETQYLKFFIFEVS